MKKLLLLISLVFFTLLTVQAQNRIKGIVKDSDSQSPLSGAVVTVEGIRTKAITDSKGYFEISLINGNYTLIFTLPEFEKLHKKISVNSDIDLNTIFMRKTVETNEQDPVIQLSEDDLDSEFGGTQSNISGALHGNKDIFMSTAGYSFGPLRFKLRGYESKNTELYMNGIKTNDLASGRAVWAYWGGLNDAVRNNYTVKGISDSRTGFGDVGGYTSIDTRASKIRTGTKLTYSFANRNYHHRAMFLHSTGMMQNGWAIAVSGSRRFAEEGYTEGTFYDAWAYFASIEKKINDHHSLGLVVFGSPSKRGGRSATTQEVYDLTSTRYNPNWGMFDGKKRNARITRGHSPTGILTHYWNINSKNYLQTSIAFMRGQYNKTSLNWYNAADPRPDYYRYLPSYMTNPEVAAIRAEEFRNGKRQLDWNRMYQVNLANHKDIANADGIAGNTVSGNLSEYILEDRKNESQQYSFDTKFNTEVFENLEISAGIQYKAHFGHQYKTLDDLLGGDFVIDIDKYAERDLIGEGVADNDINHPTHIVDEKGEVFGYDFNNTIHNGRLWMQGEYQINQIEAYLGAFVSDSYFFRTGNMQNGKFPNNSLGDSEKLNFTNYGAKLGAKYKILGFHHLHADATYYTQAPYFRNIFISPRTRNQIVTDPKSEEVFSAQAGYKLQSSRVKATLDVFYTQFKNQTEVRSFYFDGFRNFVNFVMTGIDKTHQGIELGIEYEPITGLTLHGVGSLGYYRFTSRPDFSVYVDNSSKALFENETAYINNFLVGGTPQTAFSAGVKYFGSKHWWIGVDAIYADHRYLQFSALTRTVEALAGMDRNNNDFTKLVEQDKLPSSFTMNAFVGKSFRFNYKYYLNISLNVTNVLNDTQIITGGYEQGRIDANFENLDKFPPKYYYFSGIQYYLNISFRF